MKTLVTGADGFIGSHLVEALVARGEEVRALVHYNSFDSWGWLDSFPKDLIRSIEVVAGDIRDSHGVKQAMTGCNRVYHLAALIGIPYSYRSPETYVDTNVKGTLNVVQAARELNVEKVVHTSTSEVYGTAQFVPITEAHPLQGQSPYAASKIGADQMALSFHRSFNTPVAVVRPFNTYGPRQSLRAVIPTVILQLIQGGEAVKLGALHPTRDFSFVKDTVRGFLLAMDAEKSIGEVINIGSNFEITVEGVARLIGEIMGVEVGFACEAERVRPEKSEVDRLWADNAKAKMLLGWTPEYGGLEGLRRGLEETIAWFRDSANISRYKWEKYTV